MMAKKRKSLSIKMSSVSSLPSSTSSPSPRYLCTYCKVKLTGDGFCHPFWLKQEILCRRCCENLPMCSFCERRSPSASTLLSIVSPSDSSANDVESSSLNVCLPCSSLPRIRPVDLSNTLDSVMNFLSSITGISFQSVLFPIRLRLAGIKEISMISARRTSVSTSDLDNPQLTNSPATTFGVCVCNIRKKEHHNGCTTPPKQIQFIDILLLRGLSTWLSGAFLAHELIHAIIHCLQQQTPPPGFPSLPCESFLYEEGLCHLAAASWLTMLLESNHSEELLNLSNVSSGVYRHARRQMEFWLKKFFYGEHVEFSIGFKFAKLVVESSGWINALQLLVQQS